MLNEIAVFLGWCLLINASILGISSLFLFVFKGFIAKIHSNITGISVQELMPLYFNYLANYKILIIVFNLVPYISLKIMA